MIARCLIKRRPEYPWEAVHKGLHHIGYDVQTERATTTPEDLLVTWTPWNNTIAHQAGEYHKSRGGKWVVFENGYLESIDGSKYYCVGLNGFNGFGDHKTDNISDDRFLKFGRHIEPWQNNENGHILVIAQFGHQDTRYSMPRGWPDQIIHKIRQYTDRPIVYRPKLSRPKLLAEVHENVTTDHSALPIKNILGGAWAVVTWNSKVSVEALMMGIPACIEAPVSIAKGLSTPLEEIESPYNPNRTNFFKKLAYSQWSTDEIANGEPFKHLL